MMCVMNADVRQYEIPGRAIKLGFGKRCLLFIALVPILLGLRWILEAAFHWRHTGLIEELITPVVVGAVFAFRPLNWLGPQETTLILGEDFVEARAKYNWLTFKKSIRRENIRSVSENKWGLTVMDRGEFAARMLGFVFVPARLPEYEEVRAILVQWGGQRLPSS